MNLLRNATRSNIYLRSASGSRPNQAFSSLLHRECPRSFSTEAEQPPQGSAEQPPAGQESSNNSFFEHQSPGSFIGRLSGITRDTLKSDIVNLFEGCNLTPNDIKVDYNWLYSPTAMLIQFHSGRSYNQAHRIIREARSYRMERSDPSRWDGLTTYDGKTVYLHGLPQNAAQDDVERFLSGCEYDASSIRILSRVQNPFKAALVRFPSQTQAMNAVITKNRGVIISNQISMQVLQ